MARESLGFVRMVWVCPNCQSKNPGNFRFCRGCGAAQPADVQFVKDDRDELVTDEKELELARSGPDIHCGFCGARNPSDAKLCISCGADLATGTKRETGTVASFSVAAVPDVACPSCGTLNPPNSLNCKSCGMPMAVKPIPTPAAAPRKRAVPLWLLLALGGVLLLCIILAVTQLGRTSDVTGTVSAMNWQRSIPILALRPVQREDWKPDIPAGAPIGTCQERLYRVSDQPAPRSQKVCGTPYTIDRGNGYSEVVQDCQYEVYEDYCEYSVDEWTEIDRLVTNGSDGAPVWPQLSLTDDQRAGEGLENYRIVFDTPKGQMVYQTRSADTYTAVRLGSRWNLTINAFGDIVSIEPAN